MNILLTGSSGQAGQEIALRLKEQGHGVIGLDLVSGPQTTVTGDLNDWPLLKRLGRKADIIIHTASLHAPHVDSLTREDFVKVNIQGTLRLLEISKFLVSKIHLHQHDFRLWQSVGGS